MVLLSKTWKLVQNAHLKNQEGNTLDEKGLWWVRREVELCPGGVGGKRGDLETDTETSKGWTHRRVCFRNQGRQTACLPFSVSPTLKNKKHFEAEAGLQPKTSTLQTHCHIPGLHSTAWDELHLEINLLKSPCIWNL